MSTATWVLPFAFTCNIYHGKIGADPKGHKNRRRHMEKNLVEERYPDPDLFLRRFLLHDPCPFRTLLLTSRLSLSDAKPSRAQASPQPKSFAPGPDRMRPSSAATWLF